MTRGAQTVRAMLDRCEASRDMWEKKALSLEHENASTKNALAEARDALDQLAMLGDQSSIEYVRSVARQALNHTAVA